MAAPRWSHAGSTPSGGAVIVNGLAGAKRLQRAEQPAHQAVERAEAGRQPEGGAADACGEAHDAAGQISGIWRQLHRQTPVARARRWQSTTAATPQLSGTGLSGRDSR